MLLKNKTFSADGQTTAQKSCGDNAVLDCSQPPEEDLNPILHKETEISSSVTEKRGSLPELIIYQQNLFKLAGRQ